MIIWIGRRSLFGTEVNYYSERKKMVTSISKVLSHKNTTTGPTVRCELVHLFTQEIFNDIGCAAFVWYNISCALFIPLFLLYINCLGGHTFIRLFAL